MKQGTRVTIICQCSVHIVGIAFGTDKDDRLPDCQERVNVRQELQLAAIVRLCIDPQLLDNIKDLAKREISV